MRSKIYNLELIGYKICPFVIKSLLTAKLAEIDLKVTYIDIFDKPDWFSKISPTGKVPLLKADSQIIFESSVINEFLHEISTKNLLPDEPKRRAFNRSWIEFSSEIIIKAYGIYLAKDAPAFDQKISELLSFLKYVDFSIDMKPFFNGEEPGLVDISFAPFFMQAQILEKVSNIELIGNHFKKLQEWSLWVLNNELISNFYNGNHKEYEELFIQYLKGKNSQISQILQSQQ